MTVLGSQFVWVSGGRIIAAVAQALTLVLVARALGPAEFGVLAILLGLAIIPQVVCDLGISTYVLHVRATTPASGAVGHALTVNAWTSAMAGVLFAAVLALMYAIVGPDVLLAAPLIVWVAAEKNADAWANVLIADRDAHLSTLQLVARRVAAAVVCLSLLASGTNAILAYSIGVALSAVGGSVWMRLVVRRRLGVVHSRSLRSLLQETWPYWTHSVATQVRSLDAPLTAAVAGVTQTGYYAAAGRLTNPLRILPTSLASVVLPHIARDSGRISVEARRAIALLMIAMIIFFSVLAAAAPWYIPLLLGEQFIGAIVPVQIVVLGLIFGSAASILVSLLQARGWKRYVSFASVVTSAYFVPAVLMGAALWGAVGAALALASTFVLQAGMLALRLRRPPNEVVHVQP